MNVANYLIEKGRIVDVLKPAALRWTWHQMQKPVRVRGREVLDGHAIYEHDGFKIRVKLREPEFQLPRRLVAK